MPDVQAQRETIAELLKPDIFEINGWPVQMYFRRPDWQFNDAKVAAFLAAHGRWSDLATWAEERQRLAEMEAVERAQSSG